MATLSLRAANNTIHAFELLESVFFMLQDSGGYEAALDPWIDTLFAALPSVFPKASAARPTTAPAETPKVYVRASRPAADTSNAATFANSEATIAVPAESRRTHFRAACSAAAAFSALAGIASGSKPWSASPLLEVVPDGEQPGIESSVAQSQQEGSSCVLRSIDSPFWAEVVKTERLTAADHWQVRYHTKLDHAWCPWRENSCCRHHPAHSITCHNCLQLNVSKENNNNDRFHRAGSTAH